MSDPVALSLAGVLAQLPSPASRRAYEGDWQRYVTWIEREGVPILEVKPRHVVAHLTALREMGLKKSTIGRALSVIREIYAAFVRDELLAVNPAREVKNPRMEHEPKTPWLQEEELKKLLAVPATTWKEKRDQMAVLLFVGLGWRRAEVARLQVEDFDLKAGTVTGIVKGSKKLTVGVPEWLVEEFERWLGYAAIERGAVLPRVRGDLRSISSVHVYVVVKEIAAKAGVKITPHGLRRTKITLEGEKGVPLRARQLAVGHSSQATTERYDRARDAAKNAPGQVFADFLPKK